MALIEDDNGDLKQITEHKVYTFQMWRNFISHANHSVPYDAFVAICEYAEKVRKHGK